MNKKSCFIMIVFVVSLALLLCGCQEQTEIENNNLDKDVELESDVVELVYSNLTPKIDNGKVTSVEVQYGLRNINGTDIIINLSVEFYDEEGILLYRIENKTANYPKGHEDDPTMMNPLWNIISYDGVDASKVDHVKIIVKETEI